MPSTFHGLETARRGLFTQQSALYTTGHNIANANTPGYTRQRVNLEQTEPYPAAARNRPEITGQMGTGVQAGSVQRTRDAFLDDQFRGENNQLGYWEAKNKSLRSMEEIMNEPTEDGLASTYDKFWNALQDLSVQPEDSGARSVVRQRGAALADTFNYTHDSLKAIQKDYGSQIEVTEKEVNSILRQISKVNKQIGEVEPHGYLPNDLYDERDRLVDDLSKVMNVKVEKVQSSGQPSPMAEGLYNIYLVDEQGSNVRAGTPSAPIKLLDGKTDEIAELKVNKASSGVEGSPIKEFEFTGSNGGIIEARNFKSPGTLKAYVEAYGYEGTAGTVKGLYPEMLENLDTMAYNFANEFNMVHESGWSLSEIETGVKSDVTFFDFTGGALTSSEGAASKIKVADPIYDKLDNIAASSSATFISETMNADGGNAGTAVGEPSIRGVFEGTGATDNITIDVVFNGSWEYTVTDNNATPTPPVTGTITGDSIELYGLTINLSDVSSMTSGDNWTFDITEAGINEAGESFSGDGSNALALANVKDSVLDFHGSQTTIQGFYQSVIGDMGVNAQEAGRMEKNTKILRDSVQQRKDSVSNVSLDEEMSNMIKFQHAYNASARNITLVDEMLDKIINGMGLVGR